MRRNQTKESFAAYMREWAKRNNANSYEARKKRLVAYTLRNKHKIKARAAVKRAIKRGEITAQPCAECGRKDSHAHHPNYRYKLKVIWLCPPHHARMHDQNYSRKAKYSHA